jgi:hypothetical protein
MALHDFETGRLTGARRTRGSAGASHSRDDEGPYRVAGFLRRIDQAIGRTENELRKSSLPSCQKDRRKSQKARTPRLLTILTLYLGLFWVAAPDGFKKAPHL